MRRALFICLLLLVPTAVCHAGADLQADCEAGSIEITVQFSLYEPPANWTGLVVVRDMVGVCDEPVVLNDTPWPIPEFPNFPIYNLTDLPDLNNHFYHYRAMAVDSQGDLFSVGPNGDLLHYDYVSCGDAVAFRGFLYSNGSDIKIEPCPDSCWDEICTAMDLLALELLDPATYMPYVDSNIPVDIYGTPVVDGMPPIMPCIVPTSVLPTADGLCGPVPNQQTSWGSLKGFYR